MFTIKFVAIIISLLVIIEIINAKEGFSIYLYDSSLNYLKDSSGSSIQTNELFPNVKNKSVKQLVNMFTDISYCDNLDDISYTSLNGYYFLRDDYSLLNKYEGFSDMPMSMFERVYLFTLGLLIILVISFNSPNKG